MSKLTLSVDSDVVARAKRHAKRHGVSVSQMVETYLAAVAGPTNPPGTTIDPPVLRALRGTLKKANPGDHKKYLAAKYR
jgi:hypothetical protein